MDFRPSREVLTFQPMNPNSCVNVTLIDTLALERSESFFVTLQRPDNLDERITINTARDETEVYIFDNDGECETNSTVLS